MAETKITKRAKFEAIIETMKTGDCPLEPDVIIEFAQKEIEALDRKAEKAKEAAAKRKAEGDALRDVVEGVLTDEPAVIADIAAKVAEIDPEATVAKVTYRLTALVNAGKAVKEDVSVPSSTGGKARTLKAYKLA